MPTYEVTSPDGKKWDVTAPDGATQEQVLAYAKQQFASTQSTAQPQQAAPVEPLSPADIRQRSGDQIGGLVRGAGSIGATLLAPMDAFNAWMLSKQSGQDVPMRDRRAEMDNALAGMGANTESAQFGLWKGAGELAGVGGIAPTAGGGLLAMGAKGALAGGAATGLIDPNLASTGAGIGGALPFVGKGVSAVANSPVGGAIKGVVTAPYRIVEPWLKGGKEAIQGRTLNALAGNRQQQILSGLDESRSFIPGSHPNAAQAAADSGSTTFPAGARMIQAKNHTDVSQAAQQAQEAARLAAIKRVSGSNAEGVNTVAVKAAETAREVASKANYGAAFKQLVESDPVFAEIAATPSMGAAIARAQKIAKEKGRPFVFGQDKPAKVVPGKIVDESGAPMSQTITPAERAKYPVESVHYLKMALDDIVKDPALFGIGATEHRAIIGTRNKLVNWIGDKSRAYDFARTEHARLSGPVNRLEIGGQLENALRGANAVDERAGVFHNAMRNAPQTVKKATGQSRFNDLEQVLTLGEESAMRGVRADLSRDATVNRLAGAGQQEATSILGSAFKTVEPPGVLSRTVMIARAVLERMQGKASKDVLSDLALVLQDPARTAALMRAAKPNERFALDSLVRSMSKSKNQLLTAGVLAGSEQ